MLLELLTVIMLLLGVVQATAAVEAVNVGTVSALISVGVTGNVVSMVLVGFLFAISRGARADDDDDDGLAEEAGLFLS